MVILLLLFLSLVGCRTAPSFHFGAYSEGEKLYKKGEYRKAITKYEEYLQENREGNMAAISYYYMAKSYENLGQVAEARRIYERVIRDYPHLIWTDFAKTRLQELPRANPPE